MNSTNLLVYSIYREFYFNGKYGLAAVMLFIIMLLLSMFLVYRGRKEVNYDERNILHHAHDHPAVPGTKNIASVLVLYPIYSAVNISLLSDSELGTFPPKLVPRPAPGELCPRA